MRGTNYQVESNSLRVPTFYVTASREGTTLIYTVVIFCIGLIFSAIHCAEWTFECLSHAEKILWRVCAVVIAPFPALVILIFILTVGFIKRVWSYSSRLREAILGAAKGGVFVWNIFIVCLPLYLLARIVLLIKALVSLRNFPEGAFVEVEWTRFLPYI